MIIQINATVCAARNHGEDGWYKISGSDRGKQGQEREEKTVTWGNKNFRIAAEMMVLASHDDRTNGNQGPGALAPVR